MISRILFLILMIVPLVLPTAHYKSHKPLMRKFCLNMTRYEGLRDVYRRLLLAFLLVFHALYLSVRFGEFGVAGSTLALALFWIFCNVHKWLTRLHESRTGLVTAMTAALVCAFVPHMFPMAVTVGTVIVGAVFYPSSRILDLWRSERHRKMFLDDANFLVAMYF